MSEKEKSDKETVEDDSWRQNLLRQMSTDESSTREKKVRKANQPFTAVVLNRAAEEPLSVVKSSWGAVNLRT